jgi:RNA polymerase sigma-70 factor, ECF subfamily
MDSRTWSWTEYAAYLNRTDEQLTEICGVDREAFGELVRRNRPIALRTAFYLLRDELNAEDRVQSAVCKALEHIGSFQRKAKFSTWLVRIVTNECVMELRRTRRAPVVSIDDREACCSADIRDHEPSVQSLLEWQFLSKTLEREVRCIPPLLRNAFVLCAVQRKPIPEVAEELGITVHAAKSRLSRAREELRKRLKPHVLEHFTPGPPKAHPREMERPSDLRARG